jgi:bifunctional aspartokinase / homoserine dehydrogenase 1
MSKIKINIVLFGIGNVGGNLLDQIVESYDFFYNKQKIDLRFPIIANSKKAYFNPEKSIENWQINFGNFAKNYSIQDIIEYAKNQELENLIAIDATASQEFIKNYETLIEAGFNIVAANKKANTQNHDYYKNLRQNLIKYDKSFLYETNVGAGLPVINTIKNLYLSGEKISKIRGVFSGSISYIFNRFSTEEISFSSILRDAERLGLTEPDSRDDLSGHDVARKLLILARELDQEIEFSDIKIETLLLPNLNENNTLKEFETNKKLLDKPFEIAKITQFGTHVLRYIGEIDLENQNFIVKLVSEPRNSPLGQLKGADNLIEIYTESYGEIPIVIQGAGAGGKVTARGVLSDILIISNQLKTKDKVFY